MTINWSVWPYSHISLSLFSALAMHTRLICVADTRYSIYAGAFELTLINVNGRFRLIHTKITLSSNEARKERTETGHICNRKTIFTDISNTHFYTIFIRYLHRGIRTEWTNIMT